MSDVSQRDDRTAVSRVELPSGGWVELAGIGAVTNGTRKAALLATERSDERLMILIDLAAWDVLARDLILAWSFDLPLPKDRPSALDDLSLEDSNTIYNTLRPLVNWRHLFLDFDPTPDPEAPTQP